MLVSELISRLQQQDPNMSVAVLAAGNILPLNRLEVKTHTPVNTQRTVLVLDSNVLDNVVESFWLDA